MIGSESYRPRILCVALPDLLLRVIEHAFTKGGIDHQVVANSSESILKIGEFYFDLVIITEHTRYVEVALKNADDVYPITPVLDISPLQGHTQVLAGINKILLDEVGPNWEYFEAAFPDDPNVIASLRVELKKELDYFEESFLRAFDKEDRIALRDAIHRIEVVCEQLKLNALLRSFYYLRKNVDFNEVHYLKDHMRGVIGSINSRLH